MHVRKDRHKTVGLDATSITMQQYRTVRNAFEVLGEASQRPGSCANWDHPATDEAKVAQDSESRRTVLRRRVLGSNKPF
jgi:hypothetical protein